MFSVLQFRTYGTGFTDIKLSWNWGAIHPVTGKVDREYDTKSFRSTADAQRYVESKKLWWLREMVRKYIEHKQILMSVSDRYFISRKIGAMRACSNILMHLEELTLKHLCRMVLLLKKEMEKILPSPRN